MFYFVLAKQTDRSEHTLFKCSIFGSVTNDLPCWIIYQTICPWLFQEYCITKKPNKSIFRMESTGLEIPNFA